MRISGVAKKGLALVLTMAVAVGGVAIAPSQASAKKAKSKTVTARVYFAGTAKDADCLWVKGNGEDAPKMEKSVKLTKGKKSSTVTFTITKPKTYEVGKDKVKLKKITGATVLTVDLVDVLSSFKKVKYSDITVKCDGKPVKFKTFQGCYEQNDVNNKNNWRISFCNKWGMEKYGDKSYKTNKPKSFAFKKNMTISFKVTAK